MLTVALLCLGLVPGIGLIVLGYKSNDTDTESCFLVIGVFMLLCVLILGVGLGSDQYSKARSLPFKIAALQRTIAEQQALLKEDNELAPDLEGFAIKRQLFENIKERNNLIARAEYIQTSIWWFVKLPRNWREIAGLADQD